MNFHKLKPLKISRSTGVGILVLLLSAIVIIAIGTGGEKDFDLARREILLRRIGHELLLQSGDSSSRVLPVKELGPGNYQLSFEKPFSFQPQLLVRNTQQQSASDPLREDYIVNVVKASDGSIAYGYAISKNGKTDVISCLGRKQPSDQYLLNIRFRQEKMLSARNGYVLGGLTLLAFVSFAFLRRKRQATTTRLPQETGGNIALSSMLFDPENRRLIFKDSIVELTKTEARVLSIFASSPNEVIERSRLQKEIWEDEGVIVGRSLDMFISKLRKKLEADPMVKIVVIRGKGYRLDVPA